MHAVTEKDTLRRIATAYQTNRRVLVRLNPGLTSNLTMWDVRRALTLAAF